LLAKADRLFFTAVPAAAPAAMPAITGKGIIPPKTVGRVTTIVVIVAPIAATVAIVPG